MPDSTHTHPRLSAEEKNKEILKLLPLLSPFSKVPSCVCTTNRISIGTAQDFSELRQTIDDAFTKLEELEEEGRRSKVIDQIHSSPPRFIIIIRMMLMSPILLSFFTLFVYIITLLDSFSLDPSNRSLSVCLSVCTSSLQYFQSRAFKSSQNHVGPNILYIIG